MKLTDANIQRLILIKKIRIVKILIIKEILPNNDTYLL